MTGWDDFLRFWPIISFFATWLSAIVLYLIRQHNKSVLTEKNIQAFQEWMSSFQKTNLEKHKELDRALDESKGNVQLTIELVEKELENKILRDKQANSEELRRLSDKLDLFSQMITKVSTSSEHIMTMLNKMSDRQTKQDELNLEIYKQMNRR